MDFANIKEAAGLKQEASIEEPTSLMFREGFATDISGEQCLCETHTPSMALSPLGQVSAAV